MQASRIDKIFIRTNFCSLVERCKIKPVTIQSTDHQRVYINFVPGVSEKGRGYWKTNNSILQELLINNLIDKYIYDKVNNNVDCRLWWNVLKIEIREATIISYKLPSHRISLFRRSVNCWRVSAPARTLQLFTYCLNNHSRSRELITFV